MLVYEAVSLICLAIMLAIVGVVLGKIIKLPRSERINYIRNFKRGQCFIVYLVAIPLYLVSYMYNGKSFVDAAFDAISKSIYLIALKFDTANVANLLADSLIFKIAIYTCFALVILNALMIAISWGHQRFWEFRKWIFFKIGNKSKCIILGANDQSVDVYDPDEKKTRKSDKKEEQKKHSAKKIVVDVLSKDKQAKLYIDNVGYKAFKEKDSLQSWLNRQVKKLTRKYKKIDAKRKKSDAAKEKLNVIINFQDEKKNLYWCGKFVEFIRENGDEFVQFIDVYVFGDREFEDVYSKYEKAAKGCLHYVNEYRQIAIDFIDQYPLTEFMNDRQLDTEKSLIKDGVDINVSMIGFGRTNQQIFLSMVANNQFLTENAKGEIKDKSVTYHLFDKRHNNGHKNLNHTYFRYKHVFYNEEGKLTVNKEDYLDLPVIPAEEFYHDLDINDIKFYDDLKATLSFKKEAINYIIVSLGMDYASIDMANKIASKLKEWNAQNCHVFVRVRDDDVLKDKKVFLDLDVCHPFGAGKKVVYDYAHIIQEKFNEMAIMRNCAYDIEKDMRHENFSETDREASRQKWYVVRNAIERESNVYCCLSLRSKLHLMGFDYCKQNEPGKEITEKEFLNEYAAGDMPKITYDKETNLWAISYPTEFISSRRKTMAVQEHARWNAYMIMKGFLPATKKQIAEEKDENGEYTNGRTYEMRRHGCLTTFDGLYEYREKISFPFRKDGKTEEKSDVIKYDYQLLDGAWWLLNQNGFKIIRR